LDIGRGRKARKGRIRILSQHPQPKLAMNEIITILDTLSPHLNPRILRQMMLIVEAILAMIGWVTMPGLSRWTEKGDS
jgi:hypothetical protein